MNSLPLPAWVDDLDARVERHLAATRGGGLDAPAHLLSSAADRSKLWVGIAALRAAVDRHRGRRVARRVITTVIVQSAVVHYGFKALVPRERPGHRIPLRFGARRPPSGSFPSGHAASAACAALLLGEGTPLTPPLFLLALAVGWSRVHTGLHHASDVAAGLAVGTATGLAVRRWWPLAPEVQP